MFHCKFELFFNFQSLGIKGGNHAALCILELFYQVRIVEALSDCNFLWSVLAFIQLVFKIKFESTDALSLVNQK